MSASKNKLSPRRKLTCEKYVVLLSWPKAALASGFAKSTAEKKAPCWVGKSRELSKDKLMWDYLQELQGKVIERTLVTVDEIVGNARKVFERCMQAVPYVVKENGKWVETGEYRFDASGANKANELLGRTIGAFIDKTALTNPEGKSLEFTVNIHMMGSKNDKSNTDNPV